MNIHEYQAKSLLAEFGVPVPQGRAVFAVEEAIQAAKELGGDLWVVKAQIHAGGRGKAGGVVLAKNIDDVEKAAQRLLGHKLVTHQTGPHGQEVRCLYIEQGCAIAKEFYLSLIVDRSKECVSIIASQAGGVDIEEVAAKTPEKIITLPIDPTTGFQPFHARKIGFAFGLKDDGIAQMVKLLDGLYCALCQLDINLVEVNPLVLTQAGNLVALDAKITFDDNGLFRHPDIEALRDLDEEDPAEQEANEHGLSYVKLDGTIGCMVNGAGLAMATMDIIKLHGAEPANFLDVGGGASKEKVSTALDIILKDPNVRAILINIFGGIMRCDIIAEGIITTLKERGLKLPMVVRLEGTNKELGKSAFDNSGLPIIYANDLEEAAEKVVQAAREAA